MVQIPTFKSKTQVTKIAGVTSGIPDPTAAAMLPYQTASKIGEQVLGIGSQLYRGETEFKVAKHRQKKAFETDVHKQQKSLESAMHKIASENELNTIEINTDYVDKVFKLNEDLKTDMDIAQLKLQRSNAVKTLISDMKPIEHEAALAAASNPNTENAFNEYLGVINQKLFTKINKIDDKVVKGVAMMDWETYMATASLDVISSIRKTDIDKGKVILNKDIEDHKYDFLYGNSSERLKAQKKLWGDESVVYQAFKLGLLPSGETPDTYIAKIKKEVYEVEGEREAKQNPESYLSLMKEGYWKDKITSEKIEDFEAIARNKIAGKTKSLITELRTQKTNFNSIVTNFIDPTNPQYFGSMAKYSTIMDSGIDLLKQLEDSGMVGEAMSVTQHLQKLESAKSNHVAITALQQLPLEQVRDFAVKINATLTDDSGTEFYENRVINVNGNEVRVTADLYGHTEKLVSFMEQHWNSDIFKIADAFGITINGITSPSIDWMEKNPNKFMEQAQVYGQFAYGLATQYNLDEPQFFRTTDLQQIKDMFQNGNKEEIMTLAKNVNMISGVWSNSAFRELSNESPAMAHLGMLMSLNNGGSTSSTELLVNGWVDMRNPEKAATIASLQLSSDEHGFQSVFEEMTGSMLDTADETFRNITEASKFIFASLVGDNEILRKLAIDDPDHDDLKKHYRLAIQMAAGMVMTKDGEIGGIEYYNDKPIIIPQEKHNGHLDDKQPSLELLFENYMTDELLFKATALMSNQYMGVQESIKFTGSPNAYMNNMPFDRAEQREVLVEEIFKPKGYEKIYLETTDYGEYYVTFNAPGDPAHEYLENKKREPIIININRILPDLIKAWKENPLNERGQIASDISSWRTMGLGSGM